MIKEKHKLIFDGRYAVTECGKVYSLVYRNKQTSKIRINPIELKQHLTYKGRPRVQIDRKMRSVHSLVAEAFIGPRPNGMLCCHNDGNPLNNHYKNLRWGTPKENQADRKRHGTYHNGETIVQSKLTWEDVRYIRKVHSNLGTKKLADAFKVDRTTIQGIVKFKTWKSCQALTAFREKFPKGDV